MKALRSHLNQKLNEQEQMIANTACTDTSVMMTAESAKHASEEGFAADNISADLDCENQDVVQLEVEEFSMTKPLAVLQAQQSKYKSRQ